MPRGNRKTRGRQLGGQMISLSEPERPSSQMEIDTPQIQPQSSQMAWLMTSTIDLELAETAPAVDFA